MIASGGEPSRRRVASSLPSTPFAPISAVAPAARTSTFVILSVTDDAVAEVCAVLAEGGGFGPGQFVVHVSGSLGLDALLPAERAGAEVLSIHPLQAFPDVDEAIARLPGSYIAVTARSEPTALVGEGLARDLGGRPFRLADEAKPLYHAGAVFASNYLVACLAIAERLLRLAGVTEDPSDLLRPLSEAVLDTTLRRGPGQALTGPAARGDVDTVARHLAALSERAPDVAGPYVDLARLAAGVASHDGRLSDEARARLEEEITRWR